MLHNNITDLVLSLAIWGDPGYSSEFAVVEESVAKEFVKRGKSQKVSPPCVTVTKTEFSNNVWHSTMVVIPNFFIEVIEYDVFLISCKSVNFRLQR